MLSILWISSACSVCFCLYNTVSVSVCVSLCRGVRSLMCSSVVYVSHYSSFLFLFQSCDHTEGCNWLGEEKGSCEMGGASRTSDAGYKHFLKMKKKKKKKAKTVRLWIQHGYTVLRNIQSSFHFEREIRPWKNPLLENKESVGWNHFCFTYFTSTIQTQSRKLRKYSRILLKSNMHMLSVSCIRLSDAHNGKIGSCRRRHVVQNLSVSTCIKHLL